MKRAKDIVNVTISILLIGFIGLSIVRLGLFWLTQPSG